MKTGTILDTDMTTLWRMIRQGFAWWLDELAALRPGGGSRLYRPLTGRIAEFGSDGLIRIDGETVPPDAEASQQSAVAATIIIPEPLCLIRTTMLPSMRVSDLRKLVMLDLDRLMPFPPDSAYADVWPTGNVGANGQIEIAIAALPKTQANAVHQAATAAGLSPVAMGLASPDGRQIRFDFLPGLVSDGVASPPKTGRSFWWWLVALLFLLNVALLVVRDIDRLNRLSSLVESQQSAANAVRRLAQTMSGEQRIRSELLARRQRDNALAALAFVTRVMPPGAWIQRYSWNGATLRLAGYKRDNVDVVAALRKSGAFVTVRASASDVAAESTTGQPFDITAEWKRGVVK